MLALELGYIYIYTVRHADLGIEPIPHKGDLIFADQSLANHFQGWRSVAKRGEARGTDGKT